MKTQDNTQNALQSANRLLEKYRQQDTTAKACGFASYIDMYVEVFEAKTIDYSVLSSMAQRFPHATRIALNY